MDWRLYITAAGRLTRYLQHEWPYPRWCLYIKFYKEEVVFRFKGNSCTAITSVCIIFHMTGFEMQIKLAYFEVHLISETLLTYISLIF